MARASRTLYQCSRCGNYMPPKERFKKENIVRRPDGSKVKYWQDLCPSCGDEDVEGKDLVPVPTRRAKSADDEQAPKPDDTGSGERRTASSSTTVARRGRTAEDSDGVGGHRTRSTTSGAR